jgi:hypothetical protein
MKCKISCSFGEIIDKITILKIKLEHAKDETKIKNISHELNTILNELPQAKSSDPLFDLLLNINKQLWDLEDNIRFKSQSKSFDKEYIECAENIHKTNDSRAEIKKKINIKYKSEFVEEKIYNNFNNIESSLKIESKDCILLNKSKKAYIEGNFKVAYDIIYDISQKYYNCPIDNQWLCDLYISYGNITTILNIDNKNDKLDQIYNFINKSSYPTMINNKFKIFFNRIYCINLLHQKKYDQLKSVINYYNDIEGPNINYSNMSFFKKNDKNKTLLIYDGGGLGDFIMFARIIFKLCDKYKYNKIICLLNHDRLEWLMCDLFKNFSNLTIIPFYKRELIKQFDYHCSIFSVFLNLGLQKYQDIFFNPYLKDIRLSINDSHINLINKIKTCGKKTFMFNWHGNKKNRHEQQNRGMTLENAIPLFELSNINWLVATKDISLTEYEILNKYNVTILNKEINNYDHNKAFYDTMVILKNIDGIVSTDTSLVHLSLTMGIKTYVLLTLGADWRWDRDCDTTLWYPEAILIRQKKLHKWDSVITELQALINV